MKEKRKKFYDNKVKLKEKDFKIGDFVLVRQGNRHKLENVYEGPYEITDIDKHNCYLKIKNKINKIHKDRIKQYYTAINFYTSLEDIKLLKIIQ